MPHLQPIMRGRKRAGWMPAALAALGAGALLASAPAAQAQRGDFDHEGLAKQMLEAHVRPGYDRLAATTAALKTGVDAACAKREAGQADAVKAAFREAVLAWSRVEHLRFGPATEGNRFERILFWPDRQRIGERQVAQILAKRDETALVAAEMGKKSVAVQGLAALELVLYGKSSPSIVTDTPEGKFACGYAGAIAGNLAGLARELVAAWGPDGAFTALWLKPGEQNPIYKAPNGPTFEMLKAYKFGIDNPREIKLLPAMGLKRLGVGGAFAPKSKPPFELSGLSLATIIANTEGVLEFYDKGGFAERLAVNEPETAKLIRSELQAVVKGLKEVEPAGPAAFEDKAQIDKLAALREPFISALLAGGEALATASGMALGFTDDDGD